MAMASKLSTTLHRLSLKFLGKLHGLNRWTFSSDHDALLYKLHFTDDSITLRFTDDQASKYWKKTGSFRIAILEGNATLLNNNEFHFFLQALNRLDDGSIHLDKTEQSKRSLPSSSNQVTPIVSKEKQLLAHKDIEQELHRAAYHGMRSTISMDLYPHIAPLGTPITTDKILEQWQQTVDMIANGKAPKKLGLYTHIPFCTVACTFCYCAKTDDFKKKLFQDYFEWLMNQVDLFAPIFKGSNFTSWYFGGGTPSLLPSHLMAKMFNRMHTAFPISPGTQVIFEGNPDSLSDKKIKVLSEIGKVTRLTIGLQTLDDEVQKKVKRYNKPKHVIDAIESARKWNIPHVNIDLMAGLPGQSMESFQKDVEFVLSLEPDSIHINPYRQLPTVFLSKVGERFTEKQKYLRVEMSKWANARLEEEGHKQWMGQGHRKTRNAANIQEYDLRTQNSSLLGLGYGAFSHSFSGSWYMPTNKDGFVKGLNNTVYDRSQWKAVDSGLREEMHKFMIRNMPTSVCRSTFQQLFQTDCMDVMGKQLRVLEKLGAIEINSDKIRYIGLPKAWVVYRGLLYSPAVQQRAEEVWGNEYDQEKDYYGQLSKYLEGFSFPLAPS